jgi:mannose-6-phosphate isomerase-like protein (cupin superfamily)
MSVTRRELMAMAPGLAIPGVLLAPANADEVKALPSAMFPFEKMSVNKSEGAEYRAVMKGKLATGEAVVVHETTLGLGSMPHPPHRHEHSEMWLIREGTVELYVEGKTTQMGPGSVGFVHSNEEHGIKNVGKEAATYFVVAIGPHVAG